MRFFICLCLTLCVLFTAHSMRAQINNPTANNLTAPVQIGTPAITDTGVGLQATGNTNGYYQFILQNTNSGAAASSDYIVNNDLGTSTTHYADFGMNSSGFTGTGSFNLANAGYVYSSNGDLALGTLTSNAIHFVINNGATDAATIGIDGGFTIGSPTGGDKGAGTLNATGIYVNGTAVGTGGVSSFTGDGTILNNSASTGAVTATLATQTANTVLGALTATTPSGLSIPSCSTSASALKWTSGTGFGCNTSIAANTVTTNANLTGPITSSGNATSIAAQTGTGSTFVMSVSPTISTSLNVNSAITDAFLNVSAASPTQGIVEHVYGSGSSGAMIQYTNAGVVDWGLGMSGSGSQFGFYSGRNISTAGTLELGISSAGAVVMPNLASSSAGTTGTVCWTTGTGNLIVDTTTTCLLSLEEMKDKHGAITGALDIVKKLEPFWFTWKKEMPEYAGDKAEQPGLGAHQVAGVDKRLAAYDTEGKLHGVRYQEMTAVLVAAIKEQQEEIDELKLEHISRRCVSWLPVLCD